MFSIATLQLLAYTCRDAKDMYNVKQCCATGTSMCTMSLMESLKSSMTSEELSACSALSGKNLTVKYPKYNYDVIPGFENTNAVGGIIPENLKTITNCLKTC